MSKYYISSAHRKYESYLTRCESDTSAGQPNYGGDMGPVLVLVSPWFKENVVVTCKIGSFLCSLDNLLQKNVIVFFFENQISKWRSFKKKGYFWPTFQIF